MYPYFDNSLVLPLVRILAGIIEKSQAPYYSQVLMVTKPDGSKRMCIDYRNLNDCTSDASNFKSIFRKNFPYKVEFSKTEITFLCFEEQVVNSKSFKNFSKSINKLISSSSEYIAIINIHFATKID